MKCNSWGQSVLGAKFSSCLLALSAGADEVNGGVGRLTAVSVFVGVCQPAVS